MPITSSMVIAGKGNRANKSAFDSPQFEGQRSADHSDASSELPLSPISDGGKLDTNLSVDRASGSSEGADGTSGTDNPTASLPSTPGDRGKDRGAAIVGNQSAAGE